MMKRILTVAMLGLLLMFVLASGASNITVKGSDTLVRLGQRWAEEYMKLNKEVVIQVSGGGSGTGIAALLNGTTDVCEASRDMKKKEYDLAKEKGINVYRIAVALDGIAVFLNEANPVKELSLAQLKGIYTGAITNWKEVGGPDAQIIIYSRENNSGTYAFFKEHVLNEEDYAERAQTLPGTSAVVNAVSKDKNGIGYGGIAWATGVKYAAVKKDDTSAAVAPSLETVTSGAYPISRELYWFFNGKPSGELQKLVNWTLSEQGQKVAELVDYIPLPRKMAEANVVQ
jgi:phosphate transport system substrate-binding protein